MKLTPLDIHHKEFRHALRGYSEEEVDQFLDEVADEFERVFKESIDFAEKLEAANQKLTEYELQRQTINNTLVAAQRSAEDIVATANADAETVLRDAELKAKEIIHDALTQKQKVQGELIRIKQAEEEFRSQLAGMLDSYRGQIEEISLPGDVDTLLGEAGDEPVAGVAVAPSPIDEVFPTPVVEPEPIPAPEMPQFSEGAGATDAPAEPEAPSIEADTAAPLFEIPAEQPVPASEVAAVPPEPAPPASDETAPAVGEQPSVTPGQPEGPASVSPQAAPEPAIQGAPPSRVESVTLGELEPPEIAEEPVQMSEPPEFSVPSLDVLGDRESDIDIEEID